ncbi:MAG: Gfo/Idh/MocA family oxidoreductase [Opitutaceae bacterium]|jgi:predicted dehydrogenase|nr:Gfo/Idh/MocA family oxidoreductase [Opitutaceae bacterium]MBP9913129.1 Gfo/Idh/MocA family oxidoreductase [Opitutaceae bacterium]
MKKFNVGIIGYGWAASAHIDAINHGSGGQVTAICSSRPLAAAELTAKHGAPIKVYHKVEELLGDPEIQVVDIAGYPWEHADQAVAAAQAGKHIILEKPMVLSLDDLRRVETAVRTAGVQFCLCFECRWSSQFQGIKAMLDRGQLGRVHYGEVDYYHGSGPWYGQYRWNITRRGGGSSLLSAGCHALDALLLCMGGEVEEVMAYATQSTQPDFAKYEYPTTCVTILRFKDGRVGKCASVIDCLQPYYFHTHLVGSEGSILDQKFSSNQPGADRNRWVETNLTPIDSGDVADHPYRAQFDAFFAALAENRAIPLTGLAEAVATHEVIFAADRSLAEKRPVKLTEVR